MIEIEPLGARGLRKGFAKGGSTGARCAGDMNAQDRQTSQALPNGSRLSRGALKEDSFPNLRAPPASSAG